MPAALSISGKACESAPDGACTQQIKPGRHPVIVFLHGCRGPGKPTPFLDLGGQYHYRAQGERHLWDPGTVSKLQHAVRMEDVKSYKEYSKLINDQSNGPITLRGLWELAPHNAPVPLEPSCGE